MLRMVGYDAGADALIIMGEGVYPAGSLSASLDASGMIHITSLAQRTELFAPWSEIGTLAGSPLTDGPSTLAYLEGEFSKQRATRRNYPVTATTATGSSTVIPLSPEPIDVNTVAMLINGIAYYPPDIAISALAVTWQGPFPLDAADAVRVTYT